MLEAKKISKTYGQTKALEQAELTMRPGEIRALLGANGSGKSTIAKVLGGLVNNNSGEITIDGKPIRINSAKDALEKGIALAYQDYSLVDELTVEENLFLNIDITNKMGLIDSKKRYEQSLKILKQFHLSAKPDTLVRSMDESNKSLLEVAKALACQPRYLILDEVTACLHRDQVLILFDILKKEREKGLSILFISHRFDEVYEFCATVTILRNGHTEFTGDLCKLSKDDIVFYMTGQRGSACQQHAKEVDYTGRDPILSIRNMTVDNLVNSVSLDVYPGEIVGICGLQGQGQSEFLRAVYGARKITDGTVIYKGEKRTKLYPKKSLKSEIAFISGDRNTEGIFSDRSIFENISISKTALRFLFSGIGRKRRIAETNEMIDKLHVVHGGISNLASSLSGGNQQKLIFARNLLMKISVLLLDDPTKGVDVKSREEIQEILRNLSEKGMSCIYYSSDYKELTAISDRIVVFYEGNIVKEYRQVSCDIESDMAAAMLGAAEAEV